MPPQYALPMEFADVKTLEQEIAALLKENPQHDGYRFINSEVQKVLRLLPDIQGFANGMNKIASKEKLEAYIEKVVLPLPGQEINQARFRVGVRTPHSNEVSQRIMENYYFYDEIKKDSKKIVEELMVAFAERQGARLDLTPSEY